MLEQIKEIIAEKLDIEVDKITEETSLKDDLEVDSLDLFDLVMNFGDEFGVAIPSEDLENITTVKDIVEYIEEHK